MSRKFLIIIAIIFLLGLGIVLLWPTNEPVVPQPAPTNSVFTPSFLPSVSPTPTPTAASTPINVSIISVPQGAEISVNNQVIGNAPLRYGFQTQTTYKVTATKTGFAPLIVNFTPTDSSLRLQLVALSTIPTTTPRPTPSTSPVSTLPSAIAVPFPEQYSLNNHTLPTQEYTYTAVPQTSSDPAPTSTIVASTPPIAPSSNQPTEAEIRQYEDIINRYTGIYATDPNDPVQQGTAGENIIIISDRYFYPNPLDVFVGIKPRFVNTTANKCTLKALTEKNTTITIGTLASNQDLIFTPSKDLNATLQFWCQESPQAISIIQFFS